VIDQSEFGTAFPIRNGSAARLAALNISSAGQTMVVQVRMFQVLLRISAWSCLAVIALITLGPIGLRPVTGLSPQIERFVAFAIVGALFAAAYPRYILFAVVVVLGAAVMLELLQLLAPSRHGRLFDASVKVAGGVVGLCAGWIVAHWSGRVKPRLSSPGSTARPGIPERS